MSRPLLEDALRELSTASGLEDVYIAAWSLTYQKPWEATADHRWAETPSWHAGASDPFEAIAQLADSMVGKQGQADALRALSARCREPAPSQAVETGNRGALLDALMLELQEDGRTPMARESFAELLDKHLVPAPAPALDPAVVERVQKQIDFIERTVGPSNDRPGLDISYHRCQARELAADLSALLAAKAPALPAIAGVDTALVARVLEAMAVLESRTKNKPADWVVPLLAGRFQTLVPDVRALLATRAPTGAEVDALAPGLSSFVDAMRVKLQANAHKGGWLESSAWQLLPRIYDETLELVQAVARGADHVTILGEAADVANFAMMVADVTARGLVHDDRARCAALAVRVEREKSAPAELAEAQAQIELLRVGVEACVERGRQEVLGRLEAHVAWSERHAQELKDAMDAATHRYCNANANAALTRAALSAAKGEGGEGERAENNG